MVLITVQKRVVSQDQYREAFTQSNSGLHKFQAVTPVLEDWAAKPNILGFAFDTTADNTGRHKGLIIRLEKWAGSACWWTACPHHHYELHVKKVAKLLYGETISPQTTNSWSCSTGRQLREHSSKSRHLRSLFSARPELNLLFFLEKITSNCVLLQLFGLMAQFHFPIQRSFSII